MDGQKKNAWWRRPAGWICAFLGTLGIQAAAYLLCEAGVWLMNWLSGMSTVAIVVLVLLGGGIYTSLFLYSMVMLPSMTVYLSNSISKSRRGVRYWVFGIYTIAGCALLIYAGIVGAVSGGPMVWYYIRFAYIIIASAFMILSGVAEAEPENAAEKKGGKTVPAWLLVAVCCVAVAIVVYLLGVYVPGIREESQGNYDSAYQRGYTAGKDAQYEKDLKGMTYGNKNLKTLVALVESQYGVGPREAYDLVMDYADQGANSGYSYDEYENALEAILYFAELVPEGD